MKYGIIKVKRAFLYEENGVDVVDEVFFGWSVMWEDCHPRHDYSGHTFLAARTAVERVAF